MAEQPITDSWVGSSCSLLFISPNGSFEMSNSDLLYFSGHSCSSSFTAAFFKNNNNNNKILRVAQFCFSRMKTFTDSCKWLLLDIVSRLTKSLLHLGLSRLLGFVDSKTFSGIVFVGVIYKLLYTTSMAPRLQKAFLLFSSYSLACKGAPCSCK